MKLALIFMACFVGLSYQQRYIWPMPYAPRAHLMPLFYADGKPADFENLAQVREIDNQPSEQENKFLLQGISNLIPSSLRPSNIFGPSTVTSFSTATLTVSTVTTVKCLASSAFATPASITACARRRRRSIEDLLDETPKSAIEPAQPIALEASVAVESLPLAETKEIPIIESSKEKAIEETNTGERLLFNFPTAKPETVLQTTTVTSFTAVTIKSTVNLVATSAQLGCKPAGYEIC